MLFSFRIINNSEKHCQTICIPKREQNKGTLKCVENRAKRHVQHFQEKTLWALKRALLRGPSNCEAKGPKGRREVLLRRRRGWLGLGPEVYCSFIASKRHSFGGAGLFC